MTTGLFQQGRRRRIRVIDRLRRMSPGVTWTYERERHRWISSAGFYIQPYSAFSPRYDGDDEHFVTEYYRSDTNERIYL